MKFDTRENQLNVMIYLMKLYIRGYDIESIEKTIRSGLGYNYI